MSLPDSGQTQTETVPLGRLIRLGSRDGIGMGPGQDGETTMEAAAMKERMQAAPNGLTEELHPPAEPYMTRAARAVRTAWRLVHLAEWDRELETLFHHDPAYAYDIIHEYEGEWTTDPDHSGNGVEFREYGGGVLVPIDDRRTLLEGAMLNLLWGVLGDRVESQGCLYFAGGLAARLDFLTRRDHRGSYVKPDLMVFPSAYDLPAGAHRDRRAVQSSPGPGRTSPAHPLRQESPLDPA